MNNSQLSINQRKTLALFDNEAQLTVGQVAKKINIPRPTAKQTLLRLTELGLISRLGSGRASHYVAKNEDEIYDSKGNKLITVYKGLDSFRNMFRSIKNDLKAGDFYWSFAFKNEYHNASLANFLVEFHSDLTKKGVDDRSIVSKEVESVIRETYKAVPELKIRSTDQGVPVGMIVLKDRVINLVWGDKPMAVVIKTPVICKYYTDFFLSVWDKSGRK